MDLFMLKLVKTLGQDKTKMYLTYIIVRIKWSITLYD